MEAKGYAKKWLEKAEHRGVPLGVVAEIARRHDNTPESFRILEEMEAITDPDGKSYLLIPPGTGGHDAREATLMTYVVNAGTGYGSAGIRAADFSQTPHCGPEEAAN